MTNGAISVQHPAGTFKPRCAKCGDVASTVFLTRAEGGRYRFVYEGIGGGTADHGDRIAEEQAVQYVLVFSEPYSAEAMKAVDLHDNGEMCLECKLSYCDAHWHDEGSATRPNSHSRSHMDPFWIPPELEYGHSRDTSPNPEF